MLFPNLYLYFIYSNDCFPSFLPSSLTTFTHSFHGSPYLLHISLSVMHVYNLNNTTPPSFLTWSRENPLSLTAIFFTWKGSLICEMNRCSGKTPPHTHTHTHAETYIHKHLIIYRVHGWPDTVITYVLVT